jgi:hypothetical protein
MVVSCPPRRTGAGFRTHCWGDRHPPCVPGYAGPGLSPCRVALRRAVERAAEYDRELLVRPAPHKTVLGHALNLLAGAAVLLRERFGVRIAP